MEALPMLAQRIDVTAAFGERPGRRSWDALYVLLALLLHAGLAWSAARSQPKDGLPEPSAFLVELEVTPAEPPVTPPPPPEVAPSPPPPETVRPVALAAPPLPVRGSAETAPEVDAPSSLGSETATAEEPAPLLTDPLAGSSDFSMPSGSGSALGGGFGKGGGSGLAQRTGYLAPRDFSRPPVPPNLSPLVRRNYPSAAKMYGYEGTVRVSLVVRSDGSVSDVKVEDADPSGRGFGEACTRTMLQGGAWKPRLDRNGRPVDSPSEFTCTFRL